VSGDGETLREDSGALSGGRPGGERQAEAAPDAGAPVGEALSGSGSGRVDRAPAGDGQRRFGADHFRLLPEEAAGALWGKISGATRLAFAGACLAGLIPYGRSLIQGLSGYVPGQVLGHEPGAFRLDESLVSVWRQLAVEAKGPGAYYSLPWLTGLIALVALALAAALICGLLGIGSGSGALLTGGLLASFPTLAAGFTAAIYVDLLMMALLFSAGAVWLTRRYFWGFLPGSALVVLALSGYRACWGALIVLCLLALIRECLETETGPGRVGGLALRCLLLVFFGLGLYFLLAQGALWYWNADPAVAQSLGEMGRLFGQELWGWASVGRFFYSPTAALFLCGLLASLSLLWLGVGVRRAGRRGLGKLPLLTLLSLALLALLALPWAYHWGYFGGFPTQVEWTFLPGLARQWYALLLVTPVMLYELAYPAGSRPATLFQALSRWPLLIASALLIGHFLLALNIG
jgi:hypothetical protein